MPIVLNLCSEQRLSASSSTLSLQMFERQDIEDDKDRISRSPRNSTELQDYPHSAIVLECETMHGAQCTEQAVRNVRGDAERLRAPFALRRRCNPRPFLPIKRKEIRF